MKRVTKKLALVLVAAMVMGLALVGCGTVEKDVQGDWTTSTINGKSVEDYAAETGQQVGACISNWTIKDGKATMTSALASATVDVEYKSNGFEVKEGGQILYSVKYDKDAQTLSYTFNVNGQNNDFVLKKGTGDISITPAEGGEEQPAEGGEEGAAEGGEDGAVEGGEEGAEE